MSKLMMPVRAAAVVATSLAAWGAGAETLTVVGWGSTGQETQDKIFFKPYEAETGTKILQDSWGGGYGILKAKSESGAVNWDVIQVEADELELGCADGIYAKLDWTIITNRADFLPGTTSECGMGVISWSFALAYSTIKFPENPPATWQDFWDTTKFPGKRSLRKSAKGSLEIALLADGVPRDELYDVLGTPEGVDRAFKKLDALKPQIVWWESGSQNIQLLTSGEVVMGSAYDGSLRRMIIEEKLPIKVSLVGALYATDSWVAMKGTGKEAEAQKLIAYMSNADRMAKYPPIIPYGVPNKAAMAKIVPAVAKDLLTSPENFDKAIPIDTAFWIDNGEELSKRFIAWIAQ